MAAQDHASSGSVSIGISTRDRSLVVKGCKLAARKADQARLVEDLMVPLTL